MSDPKRFAPLPAVQAVTAGRDKVMKDVFIKGMLLAPASPMADIIQLSKFRADLSAKSGTARKNEILNSIDPVAAVQAMHPTELYSVATELGIGDSMDLLALAAPEQVRAFFDLTVFKMGEPQFAIMDEWFMAALAHGHGQASKLFHALEEELQTLYLARGLRIYQVHDEEAPEDDVQRFTSPDGTFILEPAESEAKIMHLVADLYANDWQEADRMLRDAKHTIFSELEDEITRVREARLSELGFPTREDAIGLFAKPKDGPLEKRRPIGQPRRHLPARYAEALLGSSFLHSVFSQIHDDGLLGDIEAELMTLSNGILIAETGEPADLEGLVVASGNLRHTLSLGLELLSRGEVPAAVALVEAHPLRAIFRYAHGQVLKLRGWADRAKREGLFAVPGMKNPLPADESLFLAALLKPIPRFAEQAFSIPRAFGTRAELGAAQRKLEQIAQRLIVVKWLIGTRSIETLFAGAEPGPDEATYRPMIRSALVHAALGSEGTLAVTPAQLGDFAKTFVHAGGQVGVWPEHLVRPAELVPVLDQEWAQLMKDVAEVTQPEPQFLDLITAQSDHHDQLE